VSSPLIPCSSIGKHSIQRNDENRTLIVDNVMIKFTPTEYRLIMLLIGSQVISDTDFVQIGFRCQVGTQGRVNLDKHMDNLRSKLRLSGLNIHRVAKYGYVLLPSSE
jgi:DNA-binding response OmpR family regulator